MGFTDLLSDAGLTLLDGWTQNHSYILGFGPSQADVKVFQTTSKAPAVEKYPHAYRWYKHIATFESEFQTLPGDPTKEASAYGPEQSEIAIQKKPEAAPADDDDDVDLFGSESEDEEAKKVKEERLAAYREKKAAKPKVAAKSIVTMDVKPWDDETNMDELEKKVRSIEKDGLVWGASKRVPVAAGVFKLQINLVVEDDKVSLDELQEQIEEDGESEHVQSTDIAAMQKL